MQIKIEGATALETVAGFVELGDRLDELEASLSAVPPENTVPTKEPINP